MTWHDDWFALNARIQGLVEAGRLFSQTLTEAHGDSWAASNKVLIPEAKRIFSALEDFHTAHAATLPTAARDALAQALLPANNPAKDGLNVNGIPGVTAFLVPLAVIAAEFSFLASDTSERIRSRTRRALIHLQRLIIADPGTSKAWQAAYDHGETACEKLGANHLLLHAIWAFKTDSVGGRTDLVLGTALDLSDARTADGLVLTEWKKLKDDEVAATVAAQARNQAMLYASGVLAGFELGLSRFILIVSNKQCSMPPSEIQGGITYEFINIAVRPETPSKAAKASGQT